MQDLLKWPLIAAAALVVVRVVLEQAGSPESVNNVFGVTWLIFIVPVYLALGLTGRVEERPYLQLFKHVFVFALITRLMVWCTYSLAYLFQWQAGRFRLEQGGVVGEGVSALQGLLLIPLRNALIGTAFGVVIGMLIGSAVIALRRRAVAGSPA